MAEAGGIIGCCILLGCCGACFMCGRGCKSDASTQVRESQEQSARIVVAPVAVSPVGGPTVATVPAGYIVMADHVTGEQQMYAPVAPATPMAVNAVEASAPDADSFAYPTPVTSNNLAIKQG
jgi:hypothetical protein